jgi:hypothetical protein
MTITNFTDKQKLLILYPLSLDAILRSLDNQVILDPLQRDNVMIIYRKLKRDT